MPVNWIDVTKLSFNNLLLLEREQLSWFPGWLPEPELATALQANPTVEWYLRHKCPTLNDWLDEVTAKEGQSPNDPAKIRQAEEKVMNTINDLMVYVVDPISYDKQAFLNWDSTELSEMLDYSNKTVLDIGAGTGRLTFIAAEKAKTVFAVEPVENLRRFIKAKAKKLGHENVFTVDGLISDIPFPNNFADVVVGGHVFGEDPETEYQELMRVTKPGGMVILCPGNNDRDNEAHALLVSKGFEWSRFEEPEDGIKRKYWLIKEI
jgi:ubiquinone/menaquinone biosynthesis C-methylase UbiE